MELLNSTLKSIRSTQCPINDDKLNIVVVRYRDLADAARLVDYHDYYKVITLDKF